MASFNDPKLSNHIADDVPAIRQLLRSVAALDPATGNTDIPNGAKRLVETAQGYEFQSYNGKAWVALEKWNLDVQKVDGYSASTGTTASTIPVRDAEGKLPGDITGNADTASKAAALSATNPIATGGTGATTAANARTNLGVPPTSHASTGTSYGVSTADNYGHAKASATAPKALGSAAVGSETASFARGDHVHPTTTATDSVLGMVKLSDSTTSTSAASAGVAATPAAIKAVMDKAKASITGLSVSGRTVTYTKGDGTTGTITTQDTDTKYTLPNATSSTLGGVKVGSNISVSSGTISLSKSNVTTALGFTPVKSVNNTTADAAGNVSLNIAGTKVNKAVTADKATTTPNVVTGVSHRQNGFTLPSGGTWAYVCDSDATYGTAAGGTVIANKNGSTAYYIAVRKA